MVCAKCVVHFRLPLLALGGVTQLDAEFGQPVADQVRLREVLALAGFNAQVGEDLDEIVVPSAAGGVGGGPPQPEDVAGQGLHQRVGGAKVEVPTGVARFPREIMRFPRKWVEQSYNVTHWTDMPKGGHFAAMEQPELFLEDVRKFFKTLR